MKAYQPDYGWMDGLIDWKDANFFILNFVQPWKKEDTNKKEDKCPSHLFSRSQPIVITIPDWMLQFTPYWVLCSPCNFLQSCLFLHFTLYEHESVWSCPWYWNMSFAKLNLKLSTLFNCFCFPPQNSWRDCFYFVTKSSGMTCNTPNLAFNPQCNSKEIQLRAALRANLHWVWLLRFLRSGSKWAKSIRNAVFFSNEKTQASLWGEEPGLHAGWQPIHNEIPREKTVVQTVTKGSTGDQLETLQCQVESRWAEKVASLKSTITRHSAFLGLLSSDQCL